MKKKTLIRVIGTTALALAAGAFWVNSQGGMQWLDSKGLRGQERLVEARVHGYWQARVEGDIEKQAPFLHPYQRNIKEPGMLVTEGYELHDVAIDGTKAVIQLTIHSRLKHPVLSAKAHSREMTMVWEQFDDGQWYRGLAPQTLGDAIRMDQGTWTPPTAQNLTEEAGTSEQ